MPTDRAPWPKWAIITASAALGGGTAIVFVTLAFAAAKDEAHDAKCGVDGLTPRVTILESHEAEDRADSRASKELLTEMRGDVKKILERLPR